MGRMQQYLAMKTDPVAQEMISSDINDLKLAAMKLIDDVTKLGGLGFGTYFLKWVASFSAMQVLFFHLRSTMGFVFFALLGCKISQDFLAVWIFWDTH
ncbi:COR413PM2 protein [Hibiscus syriacus]|uniref:COR413PM2 protein n=1 Tax=Hibiscus syriacus TaxID=106335 RepID=A0A6A2WX20_HIBSY|nr:COR413PM2 protein [Hibiscus syriacus]